MSDILQAKTITGEYSGFADSALRDVSSTFLTAHQDLSDYQTTAGMTAFVPFSARNVAIGRQNSANTDSLAQGDKNSANYGLAQGVGNTAYNFCLVQGEYNSARNYSLAQGERNSASTYSLTNGNHNQASSNSLAQGRYNNAFDYSQAFGFYNIISASGMAIGTYNKTSADVAFVVGNGTANTARSDAFIINHDGSVSAAGKISANGIELGAGGGGNPEVENYVQTNSAQIDDTVTSYQTNSGTFLTAHQDLSDYQPVSAMTAYLSSLPAGTMNESSFAYDASDNITAYNGSAFKAGDEFPQSATEAIETVTANSGDWNSTTNTVSSNSGVWGGSALPVSAGQGVKISLQNDTLVFSNDETVLFSGNYTAATGTDFTVSESITNFEKIEFTFNRNPNDFSCVSETFVPTTNSFVLYNINMNDNAVGINLYSTKLKYTDTDLKFTTNTQVVKSITTSVSENTASPITITKVIGINRIAGE